MLTIITTAMHWTPELETSVRSTDRPGVKRHLICLASATTAPALPANVASARPIELKVVPGCGIAEGFNACLHEVGEDEFILVLNEGDRFIGADQLLEALAAHPEWDGVIGRWKSGGQIQATKRPVTVGYLVRHGLGFSHSALVVRAGFHRRFGNYPEAFAICMDYALILEAVDRGAQIGAITQCVVEIEPPGVSAQIWRTSHEHRRAVRSKVGSLMSWALFLKWTGNSVLARALRRA